MSLKDHDSVLKNLSGTLTLYNGQWPGFCMIGTSVMKELTVFRVTTAHIAMIYLLESFWNFVTHYLYKILNTP